MRALIITSTALASFFTFAGATEYEDVIYLQDGSVIRGTIVERIQGETYKIEIAGGNVLVINADEVEKITREPKFRVAEDEDYGYRKFLFAFQPAVGLRLGSGNLEVGAEFAVGYRRTGKHAIALGFGNSWYTDWDHYSFPIYVHNRYVYSRSASLGNYFYFNGGYTLLYSTWSPGQYGGAFFEVGHGNEIGGPKFHGDFSIGLKSWLTGYGFSTTRLMFKFGFSL
ncbi:MAG: hypothetical protein JSW52_09205 [Candidatus Coatesbacteria bacterium]|nr:MAG: hypothetical protein JSW52_09205 [Candidatus Coatesbacteria bacterium]